MRKWCWASQLPGPHDRLADAVERVRAAYFRAEVLIAIPSTGEMLAVEVVEHLLATGVIESACFGGNSYRVTQATFRRWLDNGCPGFRAKV